MYDVIALGELLIDFTYVSSDQMNYPTMAAHPGGAPANFLAAISQLGGNTALLGKVGDDAFGKMLIATLDNMGIETKGIIADPNWFTTMAFVTLDDSGNREFSFARKPGADTQIEYDELDLSIINETKVFHFGTLSLTDEPAREATYKAVRYAKAKGKLITYDPNLRRPLWNDLTEAKEALKWGLGLADVVKISDEEVEFLFDLNPVEGGKHIIETFGTKLLFVTCGSNGCYYFNANAYGHVNALSNIKVKDTTGAGDIFGGSAVWKLLQSNKSPEDLNDSELRQIVEYATIVAGLSTIRVGGISSIPSLKEIELRSHQPIF